MSENVFHRQTCRLCGSRNQEVVLKLKASALADSYVSADRKNIEQELYPLDLTLCRDCGFVQIPDEVNPEIIYRDYVYVTTSSLGLKNHFKGYASDVIAGIKPPKSSLVIDIGSNDGTLLRFFKDAGMKVLGIEPAREIAKNATDSGVESIAEFFDAKVAAEVKKRCGPARIVTANNIYANIVDLMSFSLGVKSLLAPDGVFIIESFYLGDQIQNMVFDFTYHEHLSYFSVKPLDTFFKGIGMELIDVKRIPTKGGSLRYTVQLADGPRQRAKIVDELIEHETKTGLQSPKIFKEFEARINKIKTGLHGELQALKAQGKKISGYGASATSTTLIYNLELNGLMDRIYDDNPAKYETYSPGYHIPVHPSEDIYIDDPDYILVLAWRYFRPISEKHAAFVKKGGHFIVPLPEVKVI